MRLSGYVPTKYPHSSRTVDDKLLIANKLEEQIGILPNRRSGTGSGKSADRQCCAFCLTSVGEKIPSSDKRGTVFPTTPVSIP